MNACEKVNISKHYLPSAVSKAQRLVGLCKQLKEIIHLSITLLRIQLVEGKTVGVC